MRIAFALAGFHRVDRGAEVALLAVARELARAGDEVTVFGGGTSRPDDPYCFVHVPTVPREKFERFPPLSALRSETAWEEATFAANLLRRFGADNFDVAVTCGYPFTNWSLRRAGRRTTALRHVFVTQNGDWPAWSDDAEYRLFACDGLVCTNPDYFQRNRERWQSALIPNGIDPTRFKPGHGERDKFGLPFDRKIVLMVSACIDSKRVEDGIRAVAGLPDVYLAVAGDGPLRDRVLDLASRALPGRFTLMTVPAARMPALYRSADAFLHMSKEESFGNVYVEALATGLAVVGHASDRLRWIVGDRQFLVDTMDLVATAKAVGQALAAPPTEISLRVERASEFAWTAIAGQYRKFFAEILSVKSWPA